MQTERNMKGVVAMLSWAKIVHANMLSQMGDSLKSENAVVYSITQIGCPALALFVKQWWGRYKNAALVPMFFT